jgi:hypothetical protein
MKGTILDFLKLAAEKTELAQDLAALARKYDFEFTDEVSDEDLEGVAGGAGGDQMEASLSGNLEGGEGGATRDQMEASLSREQAMTQLLGQVNALQEQIFARIIGGSKG